LRCRDQRSPVTRFKLAGLADAELFAGLVRDALPELSQDDAWNYTIGAWLMASALWTHSRPPEAIVQARAADERLDRLQIDLPLNAEGPSDHAGPRASGPRRRPVAGPDDTGRSERLAAYRLTTCRSSTYVGRMEFRPPSYFALATLIDGPLHGYAIVRRAAELSDGQVRLSTGTLYALLDRAIGEELIVAGEPYAENGRERRDYTLTQKGRDELEAEAQRLAHAARAVRRRLNATTPAVAR
jgi:PadR family transcriptional regulator